MEFLETLWDGLRYRVKRLFKSRDEILREELGKLHKTMVDAYPELQMKPNTRVHLLSAIEKIEQIRDD